MILKQWLAFGIWPWSFQWRQGSKLSREGKKRLELYTWPLYRNSTPSQEKWTVKLWRLETRRRRLGLTCWQDGDLPTIRRRKWQGLQHKLKLRKESERSCNGLNLGAHLKLCLKALRYAGDQARSDGRPISWASFLMLSLWNRRRDSSKKKSNRLRGRKLRS